MDDDEVILCNLCLDLVSAKKNEAFPLHLLETKQPGEWVGVRDFCRDVGIPATGLTPELFATWLPDPLAHDAYAVIFFYDDESKWSTAAQYNRARVGAGVQAVLSQPALSRPGMNAGPSTPFGGKPRERG